jgi:chromosome segregation ATPase
MAKPFNVHIVTALAAAAIASLPQPAFRRALTVALVAGAGSVAAQKVERNKSLAGSQAQRGQVVLELPRPSFEQFQETEDQLLQKDEETQRQAPEQQRSAQAENLEPGNQAAQKEEEIQRLLVDLQKWRQSATNLSQQVQEKEHLLRSKQDELAQLQARLQQSNEQIQALKAQLAQQAHSIEKLQLQEQRIRDLSQQIEERKQQLRNYESQLSELQAQLQRKNEQVTSLEARVAEQNCLIEKLQLQEQRARDLFQQIEEKEQWRQSYERQLSDLRRQLQQKDEKLQELEIELEDRNQKIKSLEEERDFLNLSVEGFQKTLSVQYQCKGDKRYREQILSECDIVLRLENERDFYPQEAKSFILEILRRAINQVHQESRVQHILKDLIQSNDACEGDSCRQSIREFVDHWFCDYRKWSNRAEKELQNFGFELVSESPHIKICFYGDRRYLITLSKTAGDWRAGLEIAHDIRNKIFGL